MYIYNKVPKNELELRLEILRNKLFMEDDYLILINNKVNMYYFTGTMQEGVLCITKDEAALYVRRDLFRAKQESEFCDIRPMKSFREIEFSGKTLMIETKTATLDWYSLVSKYIKAEKMVGIDKVISEMRSVKSEYEESLMVKAGVLAQDLYENVIPKLVHTGISEAELSAEIFKETIKKGSMGIARYNLPLGEDVAGFVTFGKNTMYKTAFDGPGGGYGTCIAVQAMGSNEMKLCENTFVYIDFPVGIEGYHIDKTKLYYYGELKKHKNYDLINEAYNFCVELEAEIAKKLCVGAIPSKIYEEAVSKLPEKFRDGFMNGGKFVGHSIGLSMDESPVLALKFDEPLKKNMTFAVEPKIALEGIGVIGTENTYIVKETCGVSLSGANEKIRQLEVAYGNDL